MFEQRNERLLKCSHSFFIRFKRYDLRIALKVEPRLTSSANLDILKKRIFADVTVNILPYSQHTFKQNSTTNGHHKKVKDYATLGNRGECQCDLLNLSCQRLYNDFAFFAVATSQAPTTMPTPPSKSSPAGN